MDPLQFKFDPETNKIFRIYESNSQLSEASEYSDLKSEILKRVSGISLESIEREHKLQEEQLLHELDTSQNLSFVKLDSLLRSDLKNFTCRFKKKNRTVNECEPVSHNLTDMEQINDFQSKNNEKRRVNSGSKPENESSVKIHSNKESGNNLSIKKSAVTDTVTDTPPISKKRRGRPPKNEPKRNALLDLENSVSTPLATKRVGRPPKIARNMDILPDLEVPTPTTPLPFDNLSNSGDTTFEHTSTRSDIFSPDSNESSVSTPPVTKRRESLPEIPKIINTLPDLEASLEVPTVSQLDRISNGGNDTSENTSRSIILTPDPSESSVSTPPVKKRRGRPPKTQKSMDALPDLEASFEEPSNGSNENSQIPGTSDSFPQEIHKPVLPKRRGRPPSLKKSSKSSQNPSTSSQYQNGLDKPSDETVKVPKKRGRKRKCDMINTQVDESLNEIKRDPEVMEESRYGRKRRAVNYHSLCNLDENGDDGTSGKEKVLKPSFDSTCSPDVKVRKKEATSESIDNDFEKCQSSSSSDEKEEEDYEEINETRKKKKTPAKVSQRERVGGVTIGSLLEHYGGIAGIEKLLVDSSFNEKYAMDLEPVQIENPTTDCRCGVCGQILSKSTWKQHNLKIHNNLAWRVGDQPLGPSDRKLILRTLQNLYTKKVPLHCHKCGHKVKSVWGFLSHLAMCKKPIEEVENLKIICHICGKRFFPVSMSYHIKAYHKASAENSEPQPEMSNNCINGKRKAAEKANDTIQNITSELEDSESVTFYRKHFTNKLGSHFSFLNNILEEELNSKKVLSCIFRFCSFKSHSVALMAAHMIRCIHKPKKRLFCKICLRFTVTESEMVTHLNEAHEIVENKPSSPNETVLDDKEVNPDDSEAEKKIIKGTFKYPNHCQRLLTRRKIINPLSFKFMIDIFKSDMSADNLFKSYDCRKSDWRLINPDELKEYLPHEDMYWSCNVSRQVFTGFKKREEVELDFKKYEVFESELHDNGNCTIYCGGPISAMSWLPTPLKEKVEQILAVATLKHPDDCLNAFKNYNMKTLLQFWKFDLKNCDNLQEQPKLAFCIGVDYGPVWHLEWCPSGCFDLKEDMENESKMKRLGLLAVAGSNGEVNIYAIPDIDNGNFYHMTPAMKLVAAVENTLPVGNDEFYASKISWSKGSGHNYIAVGYTNGTVGFFNLNGGIKLTKDVNGVRVLYPYQTFLAHLGPITALSLYYLEGNRYLMTGSKDRRSSFWDLKGSLSPVFTCRKMVVSDAIWLSTTASHVIAFEEGSANANSGVVTRSICNMGREYGRPACLIPSPTSVTALTGSEWLYSLLSGNTAGEILIGFLHKSIDNLDRSLKRYKRLLLGYTELVDMKKKSNPEPIDSSKEQEPVHYNRAIEKYSLVFCDADVAKYTNFLTKQQPRNLMQWTKCLKQPKTDLFPLQLIRKAAFNPNVQWCKTYAVGYHAGFVRLSSINFLDEDINSLKRNYMN